MIAISQLILSFSSSISEIALSLLTRTLPFISLTHSLEVWLSTSGQLVIVFKTLWANNPPESKVTFLEPLLLPSSISVIAPLFLKPSSTCFPSHIS